MIKNTLGPHLQSYIVESQLNNKKEDVLTAILGPDGVADQLSKSIYTSGSSNFKKVSEPFTKMEYKESKGFYLSNELINNADIARLLINLKRYLKMSGDAINEKADDSNDKTSDKIQEIDVKSNKYTDVEDKFKKGGLIAQLKILVCLLLLYYLTAEKETKDNEGEPEPPINSSSNPSPSPQSSSSFSSSSSSTRVATPKKPPVSPPIASHNFKPGPPPPPSSSSSSSSSSPNVAAPQMLTSIASQPKPPTPSWGSPPQQTPPRRTPPTNNRQSNITTPQMPQAPSQSNITAISAAAAQARELLTSWRKKWSDNRFAVEETVRYTLKRWKSPNRTIQYGYIDPRSTVAISTMTRWHTVTESQVVTSIVNCLRDNSVGDTSDQRRMSAATYLIAMVSYWNNTPLIFLNSTEERNVVRDLAQQLCPIPQKRQTYRKPPPPQSSSSSLSSSSSTRITTPKQPPVSPPITSHNFKPGPPPSSWGHAPNSSQKFSFHVAPPSSSSSSLNSSSSAPRDLPAPKVVHRGIINPEIAEEQGIICYAKSKYNAIKTKGNYGVCKTCLTENVEAGIERLNKTGVIIIKYDAKTFFASKGVDDPRRTNKYPSSNEVNFVYDVPEKYCHVEDYSGQELICVTGTSSLEPATLWPYRGFSLPAMFAVNNKLKAEGKGELNPNSTAVQSAGNATSPGGDALMGSGTQEESLQFDTEAYLFLR